MFFHVCWTFLVLTMEVKKDKTLSKGGFFKLTLTLIFLNISPVRGFSLRFCRISYDVALCDNSHLKAVPLDIPSSVKGINLASNKISKLQVSDFKNFLVLKQLELKRNQITQIDRRSFVDLISLKTLNLNNNRLVKLEDDVFEGLANLTELRINNNRIQVVAPTAFRAATSLTFLDISYNKINQITNIRHILQHLPNLRELKIGSNNLKTFQSRELTNSSLQLSSLDLSQNHVRNFQITSDIFPNLRWFSIAGAAKDMTWDVRNNTFLRQVSTFDISGLYLNTNGIKVILESVTSSLTSLRFNSVKLNHTALISTSCNIPTVTTLQLRLNKFQYVDSYLFPFCQNVTEIDLTQNKIRQIDDKAFSYLPRLRILGLGNNKLSSVPAATRNLPTLGELDLSNNNISTLGCQDFANLTKLRQLNLHLNKISALSDCVFKDLIGLQVLKLQNNQISKLNYAFRNHLPNLRQLRLNSNKLTTLKSGEFKGLVSLQNFSLHDNEIKMIENGSFIGLTNLTEILLQSNDIDKTVVNNGVFNDLTNLRRLDLSINHIHYENSKALPHPPFSNLSKLEILSILGQHHRGKSQLPRDFLQGLTKLSSLFTRNMQLISLPNDTFKHTPQLQTLDFSANDLVDIPPGLFAPIRGLKSLYISNLNLRSLDFLIGANLTQLEFLQSRKNAFSVIREEEMRSLPALIYMDIKYNSFTCDCDNAWFLQWAKENNETQLFDAFSFECNYPLDFKGTKLLELDISSCSVDNSFICFVSTTCVILSFMVASFTYHFLRLQLVYAYYLFLAFLTDSKQRKGQAPKEYDAFISYNAHDEPWVIGEMLPKLEGEQGWRLCLHHRDFEPGKPIIDNITDAIYASRKTICVISRRYLESEWCSREIQVASFRLFDEHKDVLILVFLEDIPTPLLSPYYRMRKLLHRRTYLSWQQAGEHTELFWEKLRRALSSSEDPGEDRFRLTVVEGP